MKHHFGDLLDRDGDYWTVVPNRERFAYRIGDVAAGNEEILIAIIGAEDASWRDVLTFPNLKELTLHKPNQEQLQAVSELTQLKRLRVTHARPKEIGFMSALTNLEELVFEYVSGFSDLSPLSSLNNLKSLHLENLRKVTDFGGLSELKSLRYLSIDGTLDWKQPIADFQFLSGLPNLEVLAFGQVINKSVFPALLPAVALKKLRKLRLAWTMLAAEEYALLEVGLPHVAGVSWGPFTKFEYTEGEEWFDFTGKGAGRAKCGHPNTQGKCDAYGRKYELMKAEAKRVIAENKIASSEKSS